VTKQLVGAVDEVDLHAPIVVDRTRRRRHVPSATTAPPN
jgi:hypothetical protein